MKSNEEVKKSTTKTNGSKKGATSKNSSKTTTSKKNVTKNDSKTNTVKKADKTNSVSKSKTSKANTNDKKIINTKNDSNNSTNVKKTNNKEINKVVKNKKVLETPEVVKENNQDKIKEQEAFISRDEVRKVAVVIAVIAVAFCTFFIASKLMDKDKHSDIFSKDLDVAEIQYKDILISKLFKQQQSEYYVLIEYSKDENLNTYEGYITNYETNYKDKAIHKIYTAQLDNAFNKSYYSETDSYDKNSLSFSQTTLVKISNEAIVETYIGNDISSKIQGLIAEVSN